MNFMRKLVHASMHAWIWLKYCSSTTDKLESWIRALKNSDIIISFDVDVTLSLDMTCGQCFVNKPTNWLRTLGCSSDDKIIHTHIWIGVAGKNDNDNK